MSRTACQRELGQAVGPHMIRNSLVFALLTMTLGMLGCQAPLRADDTPKAAVQLDYAAARHLLNRTGFGANDAEIQRFVGLSRTQAADRVLDATRTQAVTPAPDWVDQYARMKDLKGLEITERNEFLREQFLQSVDLRNWWLREMASTPSPLTERMTLFWHNHFVSSQQKVKSPVLMYRQNVLFRRYAVGDFSKLLHEIARDPAMVIYLDSAQNKKAQPNENFAREVMELFTLGEGHYSEADIKNAARAFTGWGIDREAGEYVFRRAQHDDGSKTVLGSTGRFNGDDVLDILLSKEQCARFITGKLWREFVSIETDEQEVNRIASAFFRARYDLRVPLRMILTSNAFYAAQNRAALIKSPVELGVGTLRTFEVQTGELTPVAFLVASLGQNLFAPPNVKGWAGGEAWINSTTLLLRKQFLDRLFRGQEMQGADAMKPNNSTKLARGAGKLDKEDKQRLLRALNDVRFDGDAWEARFGNDGGARTAKLVLAAPPVVAPPSNVSTLELVRELTQDPTFQLK